MAASLVGVNGPSGFADRVLEEVVAGVGRRYGSQGADGEDSHRIRRAAVEHG